MSMQKIILKLGTKIIEVLMNKQLQQQNLEEATRKHNEDGIADYEETEEIFSEINDEGTEEIE